MNKFMLVLAVCSYLDGTCKPVELVNNTYNNWDECVSAAYLNSITELNKYSKDTLNKARLATRFGCHPVVES